MIPNHALQVLALHLHNRSIPMLAHEADNLPVGGLDAARTVTTAVIVLCLLFLSPALRWRLWKPELSVARVVTQAHAHRAINTRFVSSRERAANTDAQVR